MTTEFPDDIAAKLALLTARERQVAEMVAMGWLNREIAAEVHISQKTVDSHRLAVLRKLNLRSSVDLARWAVRVGLVANDTDRPRKQA